MGLHKSLSFVSLFSPLVGMAPLAYLTRLRMSAAWLLLSETSLSPLIVAQIVGYRNWRSFL